MNITEYIESGILDVYVIGGLSSSEAAEVEAIAASYPEVQAEIDMIRSTVELMSVNIQRNPSNGTKAELLRQIGPTDVEESEKVIPMFNNRKPTYLTYAIAASWILTLLCGGLAYYYRLQWQNAEQTLVALENSNKELAAGYNLTKNQALHLETNLSIFSDTSLKLVQLKTVKTGKDLFAQVFWSKSSHAVLLSSINLPQAPSGKQYQLWAIVGGKPVDAGVIPKGSHEAIVKMKDIEGAVAFAVTLENEGGSSVPTMEEMYVMGAI